MIPIRAIIAIMIFMTTFICYTTRVNFSVSIIGMVAVKKEKAEPYCLKISHNGSTTTTTTIGAPKAGDDGTTTTAKPKSALLKFNWSQSTQGSLLGAYFWGYIVTSFPAGILSEMIGPFRVIFWAHVVSAVINSLQVIVSLYLTDHWAWVWFCRFVLGLMGGMVYPAVQTLIANWAPPKEKGKFVAAMLGNAMATVICWPMIGWITEISGWPWGFHAISIMIAVFCLAFYILVTDFPEQHRWISEEEKQYIQDAQAEAGTSDHKTKKIPPYLDMAKSVPFWALNVLHFGNLWGLYLMLTGAPKYMAEVQGFDLKSSGFLAALPFLMRMFAGAIFGFVGDLLKSKNYNPTLVRKGFVLFSHILPGVCLMMMMLAGCNSSVAVALLVLCQIGNAAVCVTNLQNPQDLAPKFAGTIFGIISLIGGTAGFISPYVTGLLIEKDVTTKEWGYNFIIGGSIYALGGVVFIIFGSARLQPWANKGALEPIATT